MCVTSTYPSNNPSPPQTRLRFLAAVIVSLLACISEAFATACSSSNVTVTRISAPVFYIDTRSPGLYGTYIEYKVTNTGASDINDLWVKLESFSGSLITLATNEDGVAHVGRLQPGAGNAKTVYFYLKGSDPGNGSIATQSHNVTLYDGKPSLVSSFCADTFSYSSIVDTIDANANKVTAVSFSPDPPELGGTLTITVDGQTGTVGGAGIIAMSPAVLSSWPASSFELQDVSITLLDSSANPPTTQTEHGKLYLSGQSSADRDYTLTYTFQVKAPVNSSTAIYPVNYINSGNPVKHTDTSGFGSLTPISATTSSIHISSLSSTESAGSTCFSSGIGGTTTISTTITNTGNAPVTLDDIAVTLPNVTITSSSSTFGGSSISDPSITNSGSLATWYGLFTIPAGASRVLSFTVTVPNTDGVYDFSAVAHIDSTQVDSTVSTTDNAPATGYTCVGAAPTATPIYTPSHTPTSSPTSTPTFTASSTPTITPTSTPTNTPTTTPALTATPVDTDFDDDGIPNSAEGSGDTDGDGITDDHDLDSDNDGIPDIIEGGGTDADGDGISDSLTDSDGDGLPDPYDPDDGGTTQPTPDTDGDGIPDYKDRDSDGDGIFDLIERGGTDLNNDGVVDSTTDTDGDGLVDEYDPSSGGSNTPPPDADGDGRPDYRDLDSDGDGISDRIESQDINNFTEPTGNDSDGDGIDDAYDNSGGGTPPPVPDIDGDGTPDFRDEDSDGDGVTDFNEAFDFNGDGIPDVQPSGSDADNNGIDDAFDTYSRPETLKASWREAPASLGCSEVDLSRRISTVNSSTFKIRDRAEGFATKVKACGGGTRVNQLNQVRSVARQLTQLLTDSCGGQIYRCPENQCTTTAVRSDKNQMRTLARSLAARQKRMKLDAIRFCGTGPKKPGEVDTRKNSDDYLNDLLRAIGRLPNAVTKCP